MYLAMMSLHVYKGRLKGRGEKVAACMAGRCGPKLGRGAVQEAERRAGVGAHRPKSCMPERACLKHLYKRISEQTSATSNKHSSPGPFTISPLASVCITRPGPMAGAAGRRNR